MDMYCARRLQCAGEAAAEADLLAFHEDYLDRVRGSFGTCLVVIPGLYLGLYVSLVAGREA